MNYINEGEKKLIDILIMLINNEIDEDHIIIDEKPETYYDIFIERSADDSLVGIFIEIEQEKLKKSSVIFSLKIDENGQKNIQIKERKVRENDGKSYNITRQFNIDDKELSNFEYTINLWSKAANGIVTCLDMPSYFYDSNNDSCYYIKSETERISLDRIKEKLNQTEEELQKYLGNFYKTSKIKEGFAEQETFLQHQKYIFKEGNESILSTNRKWSNLESDELFLIADTIAKKIDGNQIENNEGKDSSQITDTTAIMTELNQEESIRRAALIEKLTENPEYLEDILNMIPTELLFMFEDRAAKTKKNNELIGKRFK